MSHLQIELIKKLVMCPDKKLEWFDMNEGWRTEDRAAAGELVRARWRETYATSTSESNESNNPIQATQSSESIHISSNSVPRQVRITMSLLQLALPHLLT